MVSTTSPLRAPRSNFKRENAGERKQFKPKPWSHQQELAALKNKQIDWLYVQGAGWATGLLLEADQFALKVEIDTAKGKSVLTVFKHNICAFKAG